MSGNERVPDAMADFESLVRAGLPVEDAVSQAAEENNLASNVVRFRAEKAFGDLEAYRAKCLETMELRSERRAKLQPLADYIEAVYAKASRLPFIPIGNFIRANFREGHARDEAFAYSRDYQTKWRT